MPFLSQHALLLVVITFQHCAVDECCLTHTLLHPRFAVEQGTRYIDKSPLFHMLCSTSFKFAFGREDGTVKLRAIDNFSWSSCKARSAKRRKIDSVNGHTRMPERIKHDHLDQYKCAMEQMVAEWDEMPGLWKADISSAFRRIPIKPSHRWAAAVAFKRHGKAGFIHACMLYE